MSEAPRQKLADWDATESNRLFDAASRELRIYFRKRLGNAAEADDVVQEACLRLWRSGAEHPVRDLKALLFTTARNIAIDRYRAAGRQARLIGLLRDQAPGDEDHLTPELVLSDRQELDAVLRARDALPEL